MPTSTLTSKGQITLPREVREALRLQTGDVVDFVLGTDGRVEVQKAGRRVEEVFGLLYQPSVAAADDRTVDDEMGQALADEDNRTRDGA